MVYQGILCFDFDGTLHSAEAIPCVGVSCRQLIANLSKLGFAWGINTGRDFDYLQEGIEQADFLGEPDFLVTREREIYWVDAVTGEWRIDEDWFQKCDRLHDEVFTRESIAIAKVESFVKLHTQAEWVSVPGDLAGVIATDLEEMDLILAEIRRHTDHIADLAYLRSTVYLRFTHAQFHKGTSLAYVAEKMGVNAKNIFAMGDGENDLGMLNRDVAGMIACPNNSAELVKQRVVEEGGLITATDASEGVEQALKHFFEINA